MDHDKILNQFTVIQRKISDGKLNFVAKIEDEHMIDESLFHLIKAHDLLDKMIREIAPERFGKRQQTVISLCVSGGLKKTDISINY